MKNYRFSLILFILIGCSPVTQPVPWTPPLPQPIPAPNPSPVPVPSNITEVDSGKTFSVSNGSVLNISLNVNADPNFFWSFGTVSGDFDVLSDDKIGDKEVFVIKCNQSGSFKITYVQFTQNGSVNLSEVVYAVQIK